MQGRPGRGERNFPNSLNLFGNPAPPPSWRHLRLVPWNRNPCTADTMAHGRARGGPERLPGTSNGRRTAMTITRALLLAILLSAFDGGAAGPAMAQACTKQGNDVTCDDGRRGIFAGDAIVWADGTKSRLASPHPTNRPSSSAQACSPDRGRARAWCRWRIRARRARRAARSWMAWRIVFEGDGINQGCAPSPASGRGEASQSKASLTPYAANRPVRALCTRAVGLAERPHPGPPPQAGEGAHLL